MRKGVVILSLAGLLLTSACSKPAEPPPDARKSQMVTIRVLDWSQDPALSSIITAFYREHAHIRVETIPYRPSGLVETVQREMAEMAREGKVDIVVASLADLHSTGSLLPLDPYIQKSRLELAPYGPMIGQMRRDGQLYHLPYQLQAQTIIYNKQLAADAGVTIPRDTWTWEQFREAAARLTRTEGERPIWGFSALQPQMLARSWVAGRTGGLTYLEQERDVTEMLRLFGTMVSGDKSIQPLVLNATQYPKEFEAGQAAMTFRMMKEVTRWGPFLKFDWEMAPFPADGGRQPVGYGQPLVLAIGLGSRNPEAAWEFVRFAAGPEGARRVARTGSLPGYLTDEVRQAWFEQIPAPPPGTDALFRTSWALPVDPVGDERRYAQLMYQAQITVLSGARDWEYTTQWYLGELKRLKGGN